MKKLLLVILVCAAWFAQANELINSSSYGTTYFTQDERILFQDNAGRTVYITVAPGLLKYQFQDGSYLELLQFDGVAKRYSKKTGLLETFPINGTAATPWDISAETEELFNNMHNHTQATFEFIPPTSGGSCSFVNGQYICTPPTIEPSKSVIPEVYATSDDCAYERWRAEKPYLGYRTHGGCTMWSYLTYTFIGGGAIITGCFGPQIISVGSCMFGLTTWAVTAGAANDRSNECSLGHSDVMHALQQCEINNPPGGGDGGNIGGGDNGGGFPAPDFGDYFIVTNPFGSTCYREFHSESEGTYRIQVPCP